MHASRDTTTATAAPPDAQHELLAEKLRELEKAGKERQHASNKHAELKELHAKARERTAEAHAQALQTKEQVHMRVVAERDAQHASALATAAAKHEEEVARAAALEEASREHQNEATELREKLQELESALREKHEELAQSAVKSEKIEADLKRVKEIVVATDESNKAALQQVTFEPPVRPPAQA